MATGARCHTCKNEGLVELADGTGEHGPCPFCEHGLRIDSARYHGEFWRNHDPRKVVQLEQQGSRPAPRTVNLDEARKLTERLFGGQPCRNPPESPDAVLSLSEVLGGSAPNQAEGGDR